MLLKLFAALAILAGFAALVMSIPVRATPEYLALVAIAAFALAGALGNWRNG